jgi:hypothetical protein
MIFQNFFRRKFNFFPTFLGENFPRKIPWNFPWKKCTKNRPLVTLLMCSLRDLPSGEKASMEKLTNGTHKAER